MADIVKKVRTEYTATGLAEGSRLMDRQARSATKAATAVEMLQGRVSALGRVTRTLVMGGGLLGGLGLAGGIVGLLKVASSAQDTELALTGLIQKASELNKGTATSFEAANKAAKGLRMTFIDLAQKSPVTAGAIEKSFGASNMVLSSMGVSLNDQAKLARSTALADMMNKGAPAGTAGRDVAQLLRGQFSAQMISTPALAGNIGRAVAKAAKSGKTKKALDLLNEALTPSPKLLAAYENSFTGLTATAKDQLLLLAEQAGKPLLEYFSEKLKEWNKWLKENKAEAKAIARSIGRGIVSGVKTLVGLVRTVAEHWETIMDAAKVLATVWVARLVVQMGKLAGKAAEFGKNLAAAHGIGSNSPAAKLGAAAAGGVIGEGIGRGINMATGSGTQASVFGTIADLVTGGEAGGITFGTSREQERANNRHRAWLAREIAKRKAKKPKEDPKDVHFGGGGGSKKDAKVGKMQVDRMEVRGQDLVRVMTPMVRSISQAIASRSPRTALFGLGSLSVANGSD